jgi:hypothetical protein
LKGFSGHRNNFILKFGDLSLASTYFCDRRKGKQRARRTLAMPDTESPGKKMKVLKDMVKRRGSSGDGKTKSLVKYVSII